MATNLQRGIRKENKIVSDLREEGFDIAQRSAGSHSPMDIFAISKEKKLILFVQSKKTLQMPIDYIDPKLKKKLEAENSWLNGKFEVRFEAR